MGLTNDQVTSRWVEWNEKGTYRRSAVGSGSVRFEKETLFSYSTGIARYHDKAAYVLVTTHKWGVTTARHINRAAYGANVPSFRVPNIHMSDRTELLENVRHLVGKLDDEIKAGVRRYMSRNTINGEEVLPSWVSGYVKEAHEALKAFIAFTNPRITDLRIEPLEQIFGRMLAERNARWAKYNDPKSIAQRERNQARKLAKQLLLGDRA